MVRVAEQNLIFPANHQNDQFAGVQIFFRHAEHVFFGDRLDGSGMQAARPRFREAELGGRFFERDAVEVMPLEELVLYVCVVEFWSPTA